MNKPRSIVLPTVSFLKQTFSNKTISKNICALVSDVIPRDSYFQIPGKLCEAPFQASWILASAASTRGERRDGWILLTVLSDDLWDLTQQWWMWLRALHVNGPFIRGFKHQALLKCFLNVVCVWMVPALLWIVEIQLANSSNLYVLISQIPLIMSKLRDFQIKRERNKTTKGRMYLKVLATISGRALEKKKKDF